MYHIIYVFQFGNKDLLENGIRVNLPSTQSLGKLSYTNAWHVHHCSNKCTAILVTFITVTSHECHGASNHRQIGWLFNNLFRLKHQHQPLPRSSIVSGIHQWPTDSTHKGPVMRCLVVTSLYEGINKSYSINLTTLVQQIHWDNCILFC